MRISSCFSGEALVGYAAAREWRSVQVERPRASTSGGHSLVDVDEGRVLVAAAEAIAFGIGEED